MLRNDIEHKLTNTILSPLEAQRLAINMRMIENARKAQSHQPVWLSILIIIALSSYLLFALLYAYFH